MLDMTVAYLHHITSDMAPTPTSLFALALLAICTRSTTVEAVPSDTRRITDLQLLHPMPNLPPLGHGGPDETFSNIPSSAFTLDTDSGSKRTFKKDLGVDLLSIPRGVSSRSALFGDDESRPFLVLLDREEEEDTSRANKEARNDTAADNTLEWFTPDDMAAITAKLNDHFDTHTSSTPADERNLVWKLMQNPYLSSIRYDRNRDPQQLDDRIEYDLLTKQLGTLSPMTPFVNRGADTEHTEVHPHLNTLEHYGFVKERYDPRTVHYGSDKVYSGHHKHYGSNKEHYGPHKHYDPNDAFRGSIEEHYDSNIQHYYGSNKVHYDANKGDVNGSNKGRYDPKQYYGLHKHYGSNKEYYGPHKHYMSNNEIMKDHYNSITDKYVWNKEESLPKEALSEANEALCRALYYEAVPCGGQMSAGDCDQPRGPMGSRRKLPEPLLVLGDGKDQSLKQYIIRENGKPSLVV